jgi:2,5-diketo-D-gluconate reductase A
VTGQPSIALNDGHAIPQLGLGVWRTPPSSTAETVRIALDGGYRHIDTAMIYGNEQGVGEGIRRSEISREAVFVTTKVWNSEHGFDSALRAFDDSLRRLGLAYLDLYLIHWPSAARGLYVETWRALVRLKEDGRVRSIGVSNFGLDELDRIIGESGVTPVLNQVELHPRFQQIALREGHAERGIATEAWSPLGQGSLFDDPAIRAIAAKHGRTPAQVIIRWHLDNGVIAIPKSSRPSRIAENFDVFGFSLDAEDLAAIREMDSGRGRVGPDPRRF